jgi:phosphoglycolate phosphatase
MRERRTTMRPIAVFDLDGTLVDTAPDLIASLNHVLAQAGLAPVDVESFRPFAGRGGRVMIETAFARARRSLDAETLAPMLAAFIAHYGDSMPGTSRLYPGGQEALDRLEQAGMLLAICTNKPENLALRLLDRLGLTQRFASIAGADTYAWKKPDPRHLLSTVAAAGGDPARAVMIGDTATDVDTAKAAGIPVIAVAFGYSATPVRSLEPSAVIDHFDALTPGLLDRLAR